MSESKMEEDIKEGKYFMFGKCGRSKITEAMNNVKLFTFLLMLFSILASSMILGAYAVNIGIIETRFSFTKTDSDFMRAGYDAGFCIFAILIAYFGNCYNRAKVVAIGCIVYGFGAFLYALPHFTTGLHQYGGPTLKLTCDPDFAPDCQFSNSHLNYYKYVFFVSFFVMGAGLAPFYVLGFSYIDDSVSEESSSNYFGMVNGAFVFGTAIGIIGAGKIRNDIYIDIDRNYFSDLPYYDPRWLGAWWLYPMITVACSFLLAVPFFGFSQYLPGTKRFRKNRKLRSSVAEHYGGRNENVTENVGKNVKDFFTGYLLLLRDKSLVCLIISECFQGLVLYGSITAIAVLYINYFNMESDDGSFLSGFLIVLAGAIGNQLGGTIVWKAKLSTQGIMKFCAIIMLLVIVLSPTYLLYCPNPQMPGVTIPYGTLKDHNNYINEGTFNLTSSCNAHCECKEENVVSVCGTDNLTYFSPCHAGCTAPVAPYTYGLCSCIRENLPPNSEARAVVGPCRKDGCTNLVPFSVLFSFLLCFLYTAYSPMLIAALRLVPLSLRSACIGLQVSLYHALAIVPGAFYIWDVLKPACLAWQYDQCDGRNIGSCLIYDHYSMAVTYIILTVCGCTLALIFLLLAIYFYHPILSRKRKGLETRYEESKDEDAESSGSSEMTKL